MDYVLNMPYEITSRSGAIAAEIRAEMARQQKSLSELSDAVGIPLSTIRRSVKGQRAFTIDELASVAAWLGRDLLELVKKTDRVVA
ncbi:hypothetical protein KPHES18087_05080 [Corynebacterium ulcerans]|nr:hypothetical protein CULC0211_01710 [Corynebacterium ulcerans]BBJ73345.1 hypothetical protein CULCFH20161_01720 [Corynebacterium ulcerans]BDV24919.1 hypothetical protein CULTSU28_01670 [Corynebacterium ulcerans]